MAVEELMDVVVDQLRLCQVGHLTEVCNRAKIPIPQAKVGKRTSVYNLIMRYLTSEDIEESDDAGLQQLLT